MQHPYCWLSAPSISSLKVKTRLYAWMEKAFLFDTGSFQDFKPKFMAKWKAPRVWKAGLTYSRINAKFEFSFIVYSCEFLLFCSWPYGLSTSTTKALPVSKANSNEQGKPTPCSSFNTGIPLTDFCAAVDRLLCN